MKKMNEWILASMGINYFRNQNHSYNFDKNICSSRKKLDIFERQIGLINHTKKVLESYKSPHRSYYSVEAKVKVPLLGV